MPALPLRLIALAVVAACGRIDFDQARHGPDATSSADAGSLATGLVAHYPMDQIAPLSAQPQTIVDASGNGHDGTCSAFGCVTLGAGVIDGGYVFGGAGAFVVPDAPQLHLTAAFTVAAWVQGATLDATTFAKVQATGTGASWELVVNTTNTWYCTDDDPGAAGEHCMITSTPIPAGWQHVAMVWDGSVKTLYVAGEVVASVAATPPVYDGSPLVIGADEENGILYNYYAAAMDELRIYDRALSAPEIATLRDLR